MSDTGVTIATLLLVAVTLVLGVIFLIGQGYDYTQLGFTLADGTFGTTFFTLTGFHGAHVLGGVIGVLWLRGATPFWLDAVLAHVGGGFFFLATHAVFGELVKHGKKIVLLNFAAGVAAIAVLNLIVSRL